MDLRNKTRWYLSCSFLLITKSRYLSKSQCNVGSARYRDGKNNSQSRYWPSHKSHTFTVAVRECNFM